MKIDLDKLEALAKAATPLRVHAISADPWGARWRTLEQVTEPTADFARQARDIVLTLIDEVRRLRLLVEAANCPRCSQEHDYCSECAAEIDAEGK